MTEIEALVTLNQLPKIGPITIRNLIAHFGSAEEALLAPLSEIQDVPRCGGETGKRIANWKVLTDCIREMDECYANNIQVITQESPDYPENLFHLKDPPALLYVLGSLKNISPPISVIGSRKTTHYGRSITAQFTKGLALQGHSIISGLALGIDTIAHQSALLAGQKTIAVLGSGLAHLYPSQNRALAEEIAQNGALVSEFPLHTPPDKQTFPQRNRIVAAWSEATLVTEMPERSGAMITAQFARNLGRPVFAIPGPIDRPSSDGCHKIIREGAILATKPSQISEALKPASASQLSLDLEAVGVTSVHLKPTEREVLESLTSIEQSVEELHTKMHLSLEDLTSSLFSLEMNNLALQHPGMTYTSI